VTPAEAWAGWVAMAEHERLSFVSMLFNLRIVTGDEACRLLEAP
jgi:hypothetical protein